MLEFERSVSKCAVNVEPIRS